MVEKLPLELTKLLLMETFDQKKIQLVSAFDYQNLILYFIKNIFYNLNDLDFNDELKNVDYEMSVVLIYENKIIGCYLLAKTNEPFNKVTGNGVQGVALAIAKKYRKLGLSKIMIKYSYSLPFDYIWGEHDKRLKNLSNWLKIRDFLGETEHSFFTYKKII